MNKPSDLIFSALIGAVASARSMTPMATLSAARLMNSRTSGRLLLLDRPLFKYGALAMGAGELFGDKMKSAPDRTDFLSLLARIGQTRSGLIEDAIVVAAGVAVVALAVRAKN